MKIYRTKYNRFVDENNIEVSQEVLVSYLEKKGTIHETEFNFSEDIEVPQDVALWKIRAVLKSMGLEEQIENSFELLEEPNKTGAKYIWEYGTSIERQSQTVLFLQQVLKITEAQVNQIFITANNIFL